jgi:phage-related protein
MAIGGGVRKVEIAIVGDSDSVVRAFRTADKASGGLEKSSDSLATKLRKGIGKAAPFAAIGLGLVAFQAKQGVAGVMEDEKALSNLESTLKATGNAANITTKDFFAYANQLQANTGVSASTITQGAAMLGTFKAVRNEVGKGNDIFNRATAAGLDLAAKGFGTPESNAKQLGKALQDPIRGMGALRKSGVDFTEAQKDQIKALVESGDVLGAQKIILGEVEAQVKGTADAYGQTTAGKIDRSKRAFEELQKSLASALLPVISAAAEGISKLSVFLQNNEKFVKIAVLAFTGLAVAILVANAAFKLMAVAALVSNPIGLAVLAVVALATGLVIAYKRSETFRRIVQTVAAALKNALGPVIGAIASGVKALAALLRGDLGGFVRNIGAMLKGLLTGALRTALLLPSIAFKAAVKIGSDIVKAVADGAKDIAGSVWNTIKNLPSNLLSRLGAWASGLASIGGRIISAIASGVSGLAGLVWDGIKALPSLLLTLAAGYSNGLRLIGGKIIQLIAAGATGLAVAVWNGIRAMPGLLVTLAVGWVEGLRTIGGRVITYIANGITGLGERAWEKIKGLASFLGEKLLTLRDGLQNLGKRIMGWIGAGIDLAKTGVIATLKGAVNLAIDAVNKAIDGINKVRGGINKLSPFADIPAIPRIPRLAKGGITTGSLLANIGEDGREAVIPLERASGRAALADALRMAGASSGPQVINLTFNGVLDAREAARVLEPELNRLIRVAY